MGSRQNIGVLPILYRTLQMLDKVGGYKLIETVDSESEFPTLAQ